MSNIVAKFKTRFDHVLIILSKSKNQYYVPGISLKGLEEQTVEFGLASGAEIIVPQHHDPLMEGAQPANLGKVRGLFEKHNVRFEEFTSGHWRQFG
jgi:hypothetical protein